MRTRLLLVPLLLLCAGLATAMGGEEPGYTSDFNLEECMIFLPNGGNQFFDLHPGRFLRFEGEDEGEFVELEITVLGDIEPVVFEVDGRWTLAICRVIEEREWADGELVEVSRNFFGRCLRTGDVYYFGEDVDNYEDGEIVNHDGAWRAGVNDALPGLIMPELFLVGARYYQEIAEIDEALDRAEHVAMNLEIDVPAGTFTGCGEVLETTPLEPGEESIKIYAPGVGLIIDDDLELVEFHKMMSLDSALTPLESR